MPPNEQPWRASARVRLFALVFGASLVLGLAWTLLQPMVYRSSATVLMTAPRTIDAGVSEADVQNVAIQRTILRSKHDIGASPGGTQQALSSSSRFRA